MSTSSHFMNPARGRHMTGKDTPADDPSQASEQHHPPHIHIHHAGGKVHVHTMHHDKPPEHQEHDPNDTQGIKAHVEQHYGGGSGGEQPGGSPMPEEQAEFD